MRPSIFTVAAATAAAMLAGCAAAPLPTPSAPDSGEVSTPLSDDAPAGFEAYYEQSIAWETCSAGDITPPLSPKPKDIKNYQCGTFTAPMNWDDPASEPIEMGIARYVGAPELRDEDGKLRPPLFYNLGGPGGGAVDSLSAVVTGILTPQIAKSFTVVALDPRGVGTSTPIWCMTDAERDEDNALDTDLSGLSSQEVVDWYDEEMSSIGGQCLERNGEILGFVDSDSAARDFDLARALLGVETIDYLGFSYGTLLGATYADLFPTRVGRFVLDGVLDPNLNINEVSAMQTAGMEASLYHWMEACVAGGECPLGDSVDAAKQRLTEFFDEVAEDPLPTADPERPLTLGLARTAIIGSLYSTASYPLLDQAMGQALGSDDGSALLFLADYFNDRGLDGVYTANSADAFLAINALDYEPVGTLEEWEAAADQIAKENPILGGDFGFASAGLGAWPVPSRATRRPLTAAGAPDILLIGTTNDPATPYQMALNLHDEMPNSVLLTVEGWDHTAYNSQAGACVVGAVDRFLLNGELPPEGSVCR